MDLKTQINDSVKDAMRAGDEVRKRTLRMVMAAIKQSEVDKRITLDDQGVLAILQKEIKNRREALEEAHKANRADLASENEAEIAVLETFLPKAMPADELRLLVDQAVAEAGAASMSDMGKVMKLVIPRVAGRAPNDMISAAVRQALQK
ncbi:MAG TPA: GatB/YqeY domain-containing protein [Anaerolineales bacterium]